MAPRPQPARIQWPLTENQVEDIDMMFQTLFDDARNGSVTLFPLYVMGDLIYASTTTALARLADVAVGNVLLSGGVSAIPSWGKVDLTAAVTATLPATNGGTGLASFAVGDLLYASTTTALSKLAVGAANTILWTAGTTPAWTAAPILTTGFRTVSFNQTIPATAAGGLITFSRPDDGAIEGYLGGAAAPNDDGVLYWATGGSELRFVSAGGSSAGFGFYTDSGAGITAATAFASARPTSKLAMKILGTGEVGIGTATPGQPLVVHVGTNQNINFRTDGGGTAQFTVLNDASSAFVPFKLDPSALFLCFNSGGNVGIGLNAATARLHLPAGSVTALTAPLKFTYGALMTTPETNAIEFVDDWYQTNGWGLRFGIGGILFDHYGDVGNGTTVETDLYSDTLIANTLGYIGDKVTADYTVITVAHATATRRIRIYCAGTVIFDTTATVTAAAQTWHFNVVVVKDQAALARCSVSSNANPFATYTAINFTSTATNILKITGQAAAAGAATNDIVAKFGYVNYIPLAR